MHPAAVSPSSIPLAPPNHPPLAKSIAALPLTPTHFFLLKMIDVCGVH